MTHALARQILLASASGIWYPLCFPYFDFGFLAWFFLLPLHLALLETDERRGFWLGWLCGLIAFTGSLSWVVTAMNQFGQMPLVISYAVMILLTAYLGLYVGIYAWLYKRLSQRLPSLQILAAPCLWVTLELIRTYLFSGLPWNLLGYSQYRWLTVIQMADLTGVYGVSFLIVLVNIGLTELLVWVVRRLRDRDTSPVPWIAPAAAAATFLVTLVYGYIQIASLSHAESRVITGMDRTIRIGVVQANIDQAHKWDPAYRRETLDRYTTLTEWAAKNTQLVLWPEAATPFLFEREQDYRSEVTSLVRASEVPLLLGSPAIGYHADGRPYLLNSAYLLSARGDLLGRYDKQHLVPFGEYVPLRSILSFLDKLVVGIGDFKPGAQPTILQVPQALPNPPIKFGVVICYEVIFPDLVRRFVARGAELMTTITNDAWFGESVAPFQHFSMVVLRAVENRVAFARAANTGVSGFIDPLGRIISVTPIFKQAALKETLPVGRLPTFYTRFGDVFAYTCVIIAAIFLYTARARGTRSEVT